MDPLHMCIALLPLSMYFLVLGLINISSRPLVINGERDFVALAIGISGFVVAGPMELFMPIGAAIHFGPYVWLLLLALYGMLVVLLILMRLPRLAIYNVDPVQLREVLSEVAKQIDPKSQWLGRALWLPGLGVHLCVEPQPAMRHMQLVSVGRRQRPEGWQRLEGELTAALADVRAARNPRGYSLLLFAAASAAMIVYTLSSHTQAIGEALRAMLQL